MSTSILASKLYIPPAPPKVVRRPRLIEWLNQGLGENPEFGQSQRFGRKLALISAPAGSGKTTLVSEWVASCEWPTAWLSLDEGDNDPARFLTYLIAALQTLAANIGAGLLAVLQSPQPPPTEMVLTAVINEITAVPNNFILVLDDYHVIDAKTVNASTSVDKALSFLLDHLPPQMHLVITTREDPQLPLGRLRVRGQLTELRAADLRFTLDEAADFLTQVMGLKLSAENIAALETRTEGWIAGLQLAALALQEISVQGDQDATGFIQSFTGSHRFVLDYLVEEVLQRQPQSVQAFLLGTSILNRLCGPLCDAVVGRLDSRDWKLESGDQGPDNLEFPVSNLQSQETLAYLERNNLFIIPLDSERHWYRYHHLFADLLRQRLRQSIAAARGDAESAMNELHIRASQWYEDNGLEVEAFHHAAAANDIERAERLMDGKGIPLHFRGAVTMILEWLASLSKSVLDARPSLWWRYGAMLLVVGQTTGVEEKLDAAEAALPGSEVAIDNRPLIGRIAATRAVLALTRYQPEIMLAQSHRALAYLPPNNLSLRANAYWTMGVAYLYQGERTAARQALTEAVAISQASGNIFTLILGTIGLGIVAEVENQLHLAAETYWRVLQWAGDQPLQIIYEAHLGLARVLYEWNELDGAEQHARLSIHLARQYDKAIDRFIFCELFLARLKLAQGDVAGAAAILTQASHVARRQNFIYRLPEVTAAQILVLLHQGNLAVAGQLAQVHELPMSQARVYLAQGDLAAALAMLAQWRREVEVKGWRDEQLKVMALQALAYQARGEMDTAVRLLAETLALAEPEGFIRLFVDEGLPMAQLLSEVAVQGIMPDYTGKLLAAFAAEAHKHQARSALPPAPFLIEPLSERELEVLHLVAQGLSNREIGERLSLALSTVKGHNQKIFDKLQVQRRTGAVARARELGLV
ncbi:MAG: NACHT domain-containing protein [Anaerolineaceae bacterium]|nr:NACHT domain-containing protein [Anaerolineaceae bacterium]